MMKTKKAFDCVEMMHDGQAEVRKKLAGMSPKEQQEYWHKMTQELRVLQQEVKKQRRPAQG